jgi:UPF0716 protein FxsA
VPALLLLAFVAVPIVELYVILQVASVIGGWQTIALLIAESFVGTWLIRREGRRTWKAFSAALEARRPPAREVADGALVIVGGTLLLTPGFLSDILGFFFLLPLTRPLARKLLLRLTARRVGRRFGLPFPTGFPPASSTRRGPDDGGAVIDGEVINDPLRQPGPNSGPNDRTPPKP